MAGKLKNQTVKQYKENDIIKPDGNIYFQHIDQFDINTEKIAAFCGFYFRGIDFGFLPEYKKDINTRTRWRGDIECKQHSSSSIISSFIKDDTKKKDEFARVILTNKRIYKRGLNFLFGQAFHSGGVAICSCARFFKNNRVTPERRFAKLTIHEIGHLLGIDHCKDSKCIMAPSSNLKEADNRNVFMCERDREKIAHCCNHDKTTRKIAVKAIWKREF